MNIQKKNLLEFARYVVVGGISAVIGISVYMCLNLLLQVDGNLAKYPADAFVWISEFLGH